MKRTASRGFVEDHIFITLVQFSNFAKLSGKATGTRAASGGDGGGASGARADAHPFGGGGGGALNLEDGSLLV